MLFPPSAQALVASSTSHILLEEHGERMDPSYCVTHRLQVRRKHNASWPLHAERERERERLSLGLTHSCLLGLS